MDDVLAEREGFARRLEVRCDYCEEGNQQIDGWHAYEDPEDPTIFYRVPCATDPPKAME